MEWLLIGGGLAAAGGIALAVRAAQRRRREAYEQHCLIRGFQFEQSRPEGERRFRDFFEPFNQGRDRAWEYTVSGSMHAAPFTAFEYSWVTGGGKSRTTHRIAGMVWEREDPPLPKFMLSPEGWWHRVGEFFGMQDIDFVEAPEFSRAYRLKGPNEEAIRALFTPEILQFFAATPNQQVAGGGRFLFWWKDGHFPQVERFDEWLDEGDRVRRRFYKT